MTEPRTTAGRALLDANSHDASPAFVAGLRSSILAIEAEAATLSSSVLDYDRAALAAALHRRDRAKHSTCGWGEAYDDHMAFHAVEADAIIAALAEGER